MYEKGSLRALTSIPKMSRTLQEDYEILIKPGAFANEFLRVTPGPRGRTCEPTLTFSLTDIRLPALTGTVTTASLSRLTRTEGHVEPDDPEASVFLMLLSSSSSSLQHFLRRRTRPVDANSICRLSANQDQRAHGCCW